MRRIPLTSVMIGAILATSPVVLFAQSSSIGGMVVGSKSATTGAFLGQAGSYEVKTFDLTAIELAYRQHYADRQNQDLAFIKEKQQTAVALLKGLVDELNRPSGLVDLANKSASNGGQGVPYAAYVGAQQQIVALRNKIQTEVEGILVLPSLLKSQETLKVGDVERLVPAPLKVELTKLQQFYADQLELNLSQVNTALFNVVMPNGARNVIKGIDFKITSIPVDAKVLADMTQDILRDRAQAANSNYTGMIDELNRQTVAEIRAIRKNFGTDQIYQFNLDPKGKELNFSRLARLFVIRDYIHYTYGLQIGAIGVPYNTMVANLDVIVRGNKNILDSFAGEFVRDSKGLIDFQKSVSLANYTAQKRNQEVFGKGVDLLSRVLSGITFLKGESQLAEINAFVLALLERDINHELMLTEPGGSRRVREDFRAIYAANPQIEATTRETINDVKKLLNGTGSADDLDADIGVVQAGTINGALRVAIGGLDSVIGFVEQANQKQIGLNALKDSCTTCNLIKKRSDF